MSYMLDCIVLVGSNVCNINSLISCHSATLFGMTAITCLG